MKSKFVGYFLIAVLLIFIGLWCFGLYDMHQSQQEGERLAPICNEAGGVLIKTYDVRWVCVKSLNL